MTATSIPSIWLTWWPAERDPQLPALFHLGLLLTDLGALPWYPKFLPMRATAAGIMKRATWLMFTVNYVSGVVRPTTIQVWVPSALTWVLQEIWASSDHRASSLAQQVSLRQHSRPHSISPHPHFYTQTPQPCPLLHWSALVVLPHGIQDNQLSFNLR